MRRVDKVLKEIKIVETDDGVRIEISGENAKDWIKSCCTGAKGFAMPFGFAMCCATEEAGEGEKEAK